MTNTEETLVIFRKFRDGGDIIALFPEIMEEDHMCSSYMHVGQHAAADYYGLVRGEGTQWESPTVPAQPNEYAALQKELEQIGYKLKIRTRWNRRRRR